MTRPLTVSQTLIRRVALALLLTGLLNTAAAAQELWLHPKLEQLPTDKLGPFEHTGDGRILALDDAGTFVSDDDGRTWSDLRPLFSDSDLKLRVERNILRTKTGTLIASSMDMRKRNWTWNNDLHDAPGATLPAYAMRSLDDGKTWQDVTELHPEWTGAIRDIIQTRDGRIVISAMKMLHNPGRHTVVTYWSDDDGATWNSGNVIDLGGVGHHGGVTEATLEELRDGRIWLLIRTNWGEFWSGYSYDGGKFWRVLKPSGIPASSAPGLLKRLASGRLVLFWNRPLPEGKTEWPLSGGDGLWSEVPVSNHREELSVAFSDDDGETWTDPVVIARQSGKWLAYPYVFEHRPGELWVTTMQGAVRVKLFEKDFVGDGASGVSFQGVEDVLQRAVEDGAFPGCTAAIGNSSGLLWTGAFGHLSEAHEQPVTRDTIYDLASLTKVVGTTSTVMVLVDQGKLSLEDPVSKWIPEFLPEGGDANDSLKKTVTVQHLLTHTAGLPAWLPLYKSVQGYANVVREAASASLETAPGERYKYSDLGLILMGEIASRAGGKPLMELEQELVFHPLGMRNTLRRPAPSLHERIAPTERIADSDGYIRGVVHDENAQAGDGLTGHAGLFSTVDDLALLGQELLKARSGDGRVLPSSQVRRFTVLQHLPGDARRCLGWQGFTSGYSGGTLLSEAAFGHTGFTGTSIWIDPDKDLFFILLTNRVHPTRANRKISAVRRDFADAAVQATAPADGAQTAE